MCVWKFTLLFFAFLVLNYFGSLFAQQIVILDSEDGSVLPNAHICIESLDKSQAQYMLSSAKGSIENKVKMRSLISVSFVGYEAVIDTIEVGISKTIYLSPSYYNMEELVVTAQFSPKLADQSIYKVKVIDRGIVERKGASNLSDLISNELNFSPVRDAALGSSVRIQGLGGEHVKILIDGVPVIGRQNGILDLSQINVSSIDHVEVVEGPMSVIYGSNAMAGVINIITKENKRESIQLSAEAYYESVGVYDLDASFSIFRGKHNFGSNVGRYFFDGFTENPAGRAMTWNPKLQYNMEGYYAFSSNGYKLKLSSIFFDEELHDNGNVISDPTFVGAFDYYHFTRRLDNKLSLNKSIAEKQQLQIAAAYSTYRKSKIKYRNDLVQLEKIPVPDPSASDTTIFENIFSRGTYSNENFERLSFQAGYEFTMEMADSRRLENKEEIGEISSFLSMNIIPFSKFNFQPGLRYIKNFKYKAPLTYSLNIKWVPVDILSLRASYAKGFRAPSIKELYLDFQDINHNIKGNPDLGAETGNNYNVWLDLELNKAKKHGFVASTNFYYNLINNKIELLFDPNNASAAVYFNVPAGAIISKGYSSELTYRFHPRLTINTGLFHNSISSIVNTKEFSSSTDYTVNFKYKNIKYKFELSVFYKYTDNYNRYTGSIDMESGEIMDVYLSTMDAYHNMDVTLSVPLYNNRIRLTSGVKNIFDNTSIASTGGGSVHSGGSDSSLLNWGRTVFIKLSYNFTSFKPGKNSNPE